MRSVEELISSKRLSGYLGKTKNDLGAKLSRYNYNIELSQNFYSLLHIFEITLRNNLHLAFGEFLEDQNWLCNYKNHQILRPRAISDIEIAVKRLKEDSKPIEEDRIIAELNLGFWVNLYDRYYDKVHFKTIKGQFPYATNHQRGLNSIRLKFDRIRNLRNRIYHYETIWHWNDLDIHFQEIKDFILWSNKDLIIRSIQESEKNVQDLVSKRDMMLR